MKSNFKWVAVAAALSAFGLPSAQAVDFGGYFRSGTGAVKKDVSRACYGLNGTGLKYRLGNECDTYGEFMFSQGFKVEGVEYKAAMMTNFWNGGTDSDPAKLGINQMYVEGKGYDIAPNSTFWIGKRFWGRSDVHIVDAFYTNLSGVGGGVDGIDVGVGKLNLGYFRTDGTVVNTPGTRINVDLTEIGVNPGGKLRALGTYTKGDFTGGTSGLGLTVQHNQDNFLGLGSGNTLYLQYAQGSAGLDGNFGTLTASSDNKSFRIVESPTWQLGAFGGQGHLMWQQDKSAAGVKTNSASIGGRASYAFTKNFKLVSELGYSQKKVGSGDTQKLTKFTLAPTLSTGPGFWNRPELRLYVTTAKWNSAAGNITGVPALATKTNATSFGAQVEIWY